MRVWKLVFLMMLVVNIVLLSTLTTYAATSSETRKKIENLNNNKKIEQEKLDKINAQIAKIESEIKRYNEQLEQLNKDYQLVEAELIKARNVEMAAKRKVAAATTSLYEEGYLDSPLGNLLRSKGIHEFSERFDLLKSVMDYMFADYDDYKKATDRVNQKVEKIKALQEEQTSKIKKIDQSTSELREKKKLIQVKVDEYDDQLEEYEDDIIEINRDLIASGRLNFSYTGPLDIPCTTCTQSTIRSKFGFRKDPFSGRRSNHQGLDFSAKYGTPVTAVADGVVVSTQPARGYGWLIIIYHGHKGGKAVYSAYAHSYPNQVKVSLGQDVEKGDVISAVGSYGKSTAPHMHFEIRLGDVNKRVNPKPWLFR